MYVARNWLCFIVMAYIQHIYIFIHYIFLVPPFRGFLRQWGGPPKGNHQVELQWPHGQDWGCRHRGESRYDEDPRVSHHEQKQAPRNLVLKCVFAGELLTEMTVDYERAASEDRLDEVSVSHSVSVTQPWSSFSAEPHQGRMYLKNHWNKALQEHPASAEFGSYFTKHTDLYAALQFGREGMLVPEPFCPLVFRCVALLEAEPIALPFPPSW